ncbi:MAG: FCD domain-containing protein, partial [Planctomycetes bacterium]|nr:FCD domain-containing protein [Planctomycetota bacterium]
VREALSALELVGILRRQQGGGTYIRSTAPTMFGVNSDELFYEFLKDAESSNHSFSAYEARCLFEPKVAALAAQRAEEDNIKELAAILDRMREAVENKNYSQMGKSDLDFHVAVAKATRNEIIAKTMKKIIEMADAQMFRTFRHRRNSQAVYDEHRRIFEAIRDGAYEAARICCEYNILKNYKPL